MATSSLQLSSGSGFIQFNLFVSYDKSHRPSVYYSVQNLSSCYCSPNLEIEHQTCNHPVFLNKIKNQFSMYFFSKIFTENISKRQEIFSANSAYEQTRKERSWARSIYKKTICYSTPQILKSENPQKMQTSNIGISQMHLRTANHLKQSLPETFKSTSTDQFSLALSQNIWKDLFFHLEILQEDLPLVIQEQIIQGRDDKTKISLEDRRKREDSLKEFKVMKNNIKLPAVERKNFEQGTPTLSKRVNILQQERPNNLFQCLTNCVCYRNFTERFDHASIRLSQ